MRRKANSRKKPEGARPGASPRESLILGIDIGGTKVAAGLVDPSTGKICHHVRVPMAACGKPQEGLAAVQTAVELLLKHAQADLSDIHAIGVCAPGPLDPKTGVILNPPNVPCWRNFPLAAQISKLYGATAILDNDANAAALAETLWGAGRGYANVFYATIGTGIGTGIVLDGKILHGRTGAAGEGGHVSIDYRGPQCGCGKRGCIEAYAAGPAIARAAQERLKAPGASKALLSLAGGDPQAITGEMIGRAYAQGDPLAREILAQAVEYLSFWLGNVVDLLEPEIIVIGGGVSLLLQPFFRDLGNNLSRYCENQRAAETPIVHSHYQDNAGIAGAAALCVAS